MRTKKALFFCMVVAIAACHNTGLPTIVPMSSAGCPEGFTTCEGMTCVDSRVYHGGCPSFDMSQADGSPADGSSAVADLGAGTQTVDLSVSVDLSATSVDMTRLVDLGSTPDLAGFLLCNIGQTNCGGRCEICYSACLQGVCQLSAADLGAAPADASIVASDLAVKVDMAAPSADMVVAQQDSSTSEDMKKPVDMELGADLRETADLESPHDLMPPPSDLVACNGDAGLMLCSGSCVNLMTDVNNCRTCGNKCGGPAHLDNSSCVNGTCGCLPGQGWCSVTTDAGTYGRCTDTSTDPANCGGCGHVCSSGKCANWTCQ